MNTTTEPLMLGWREWVALPGLKVPALKCKVDTGARSSALHAFSVVPFERGGETWVRFGLHPNQQETETELWCEAKVLDKRNVTDSGGNVTERYFIQTEVMIGSQCFSIELSLTSRDTMMFRMLLGREAMRKRFVVDPGASYLQPLAGLTSADEPKATSL
ncbi:ATP-dependent zinc protease [Alkalimonas collagenimarina]|uniref:ATP-dependent zinc protease n=1 Tax=Alkalimonas collagenimarina TaxID=400390 RepID=A0ABT9H2R7_9GAMM|nr:ATP-dependent zinc protease [Alkalimonas collagenimarina]MDP4537606.1 ATP-dependent zinc protease [Alkalimonas collagenimarina]